MSYTLATASNDGDPITVGFNGSGASLPAEMLPSQILFNNVRFQLAPAKTGAPNALAASGQTIDLPAGTYNRIYVLAASAHGDQNATFEAGGKRSVLDIQDWGGFVGQWDDRQWSGSDPVHGKYGQMTGLTPGYIKRADLAWYASHHHDAAGKNVDYAYSYLFGYRIDLPAGAKTLKLPANPNIRILAISVASESPEVNPARPLYDVLPTTVAASAVGSDGQAQP